MPDVRAADRLTPAEVAEVLDLAAAAEASDGVYPLSEDVVLAVRNGGGRHLLTAGGYAFLGDGSGELVVHPAERRRGLGRALLAAAGESGAGESGAGENGAGESGESLQGGQKGPLTFWAHGDLPAAQAFAARAGFERSRLLWQMRRPLTDADRVAVTLPEGVTVRQFRPGYDEDAWLAVNSRAFASHPEQGKWTRRDVELREAEPWFDPADFLLAVDVADTVLGFHWMKIADGIGEIYVLGVDPGGHRRGLGAALTVAGLSHLRDRGLDVAGLYVDESNTAAVALYRRMGFTVYTTDAQYQR